MTGSGLSASLRVNGLQFFLGDFEACALPSASAPLDITIRHDCAECNEAQIVQFLSHIHHTLMPPAPVVLRCAPCRGAKHALFFPSPQQHTYNLYLNLRTVAGKTRPPVIPDPVCPDCKGTGRILLLTSTVPCKLCAILETAEAPAPGLYDPSTAPTIGNTVVAKPCQDCGTPAYPLYLGAYCKLCFNKLYGSGRGKP